MDEQYYRTMYELEDKHWWFVGKRRLVYRAVQRFVNGREMHALDVGCGTGMMLTRLGEHGLAVGTDASESALSFCRKRGHSKIVRSTAVELPFLDETFDLVTALDVLTHRRVGDDMQALMEFRRVLKQTGLLITTDPALPCLWSPHDVTEATRERYTRGGFVRKMKDAGFRIEKATYWNSLLLLPILIIRAAKALFLGKTRASSDLFAVPAGLNQMLALILKLEGCLLQEFDLPLGVSVLCIGRKE